MMYGQPPDANKINHAQYIASSWSKMSEFSKKKPL